MPKKKRVSQDKKSVRRQAPVAVQFTQDAVDRLEKLAADLDIASKEANALAGVVRTEIADEIAAHLINTKERKPTKTGDEPMGRSISIDSVTAGFSGPTYAGCIVLMPAKAHPNAAPAADSTTTRTG